MKTTKANDPRYKINLNKPIKVYRNLHKQCWSVQQDGLVKAHTNSIKLFDCEFIVNQAGREKVIKERRKNVHAFIKGYISELFNTILDEHFGTEVTYNPYKNEFFYKKESGESIRSADAVLLDDRKVFSF
jgi:hypothetical protein